MGGHGGCDSQHGNDRQCGAKGSLAHLVLLETFEPELMLAPGQTRVKTGRRARAVG